MRQFLLLTFLVLSSLLIHAQNSPDFFRAIPPIDGDTPEWAALMYSDNPNVIEVENLYREYYQKNPFVKTLHTKTTNIG